MKYMFVPSIQIVPQWKKCYYSSNSLYKLLQISQKAIQIRQKVTKAIMSSTEISNKKYLTIETSTNVSYTKKSFYQIQRIQGLSRLKFEIEKIVEACSLKFYQYSQNEMKILYYFVQFKIFSLNKKANRMISYSQIVNKYDQDFINIIENTYIEIYYLQNMFLYNRSQQSNIVKQYQLNLLQHQIMHQSNAKNRKFDRLQHQVQKIKKNLTNIYKNKQQISQKSINQLMNYGDVNPENIPKQFHFIGFLMGSLFVALASVIFLKYHYQINIQTNKTYQADFPIWRGASYFIAFQWIMGFYMFFLQHTQLNYKMILSLDGECLPRSKLLFIDAGVTTCIFLFLFALYLLELGGQINTDFRYFGQLMWLVQIAYFLVPIPFRRNQGKFYFIKLFIQTILVPFPFMKASLHNVWISQQIVSFSQPLVDFFYTVCKTENLTSKCDTADINLIILLVIFTYRINISCKLLYQRQWVLIPPYFGIFRAFSAMVTATVSYLYRKNLSNDLFALFIICAVVSTSCAVYADLRGDWGLFQKNFLRKNLFFKSRTFYYVCVVIDIILRCNWTLNLSPNIVNSMQILNFYLIMVVTYLQLVRRGIWNIFWLQCWHIQNCQKFMATIDDSQIQKRIVSRYQIQLKNTVDKNIKQPVQQKQLEQVRDKQQRQLLNKGIKRRYKLKASLNEFFHQYQGQLQIIEQRLNQFS